MADTKTSTSSADGTTARTGFLDLSAELRNKIYDLALIEDKTLFVTRTRPIDSIRSTPKYRAHIACKPPYNVFEDPDRWSFTRTSLCVAILSTCRQINREATPILYGANTFLITLVRGPEMFVHLPKSARQHIRHLHLNAWCDFAGNVQGRIQNIAQFVPLLPKLSKLTLLVDRADLEWWANNEDPEHEWSPARLAGKFSRLFQAIKKARNLNDEEVLALIEFHPGHVEFRHDSTHGIMFYHPDGLYETAQESYGSRFKEEMKQLLKGSPAED